MRTIIRAAGLAIGLAATPVMAQDQEPQPGAAFTQGMALSEADLGAIAGREDRGTLIAQADQRNTVQNNSVVGNSVTGTVTIDGQAFSNLSGLAVISANSGNNVAINSAMNVVINLAPQ